MGPICSNTSNCCLSCEKIILLFQIFTGDVLICRSIDKMLKVITAVVLMFKTNLLCSFFKDLTVNTYFCPKDWNFLFNNYWLSPLKKSLFPNDSMFLLCHNFLFYLFIIYFLKNELFSCLQLHLTMWTTHKARL